MTEKTLKMFEEHVAEGRKLLNADSRELLAEVRRLKMLLEQTADMLGATKRALGMSNKELQRRHEYAEMMLKYRNSARLLRGALRGEHDAAQALKLTDYVEEVVRPCST